MLFKKKERPAPEWRDGVYLCTADNSMNADIIESKLRGEGIPCERRYENAGNFLEIAMGISTYPIDIYVPESALEDAKNIAFSSPPPEWEDSLDDPAGDTWDGGPDGGADADAKSSGRPDGGADAATEPGGGPDGGADAATEPGGGPDGGADAAPSPDGMPGGRPDA
ncbi:MAG: DUF2007 domain-containing protein [Clostridiales Family XIII bacterium]|nr:DUF2007 domain-containing protein [Clostridiales Family XIII bacterium]